MRPSRVCRLAEPQVNGETAEQTAGHATYHSISELATVDQALGGRGQQDPQGVQVAVTLT